MSTAAKDFIIEAKEQYWYDMFIKVTGYWYGNETPNMDKEEFIATRIRRAPQIEREKGEREAEPTMIEMSEYKAACKQIEILERQLMDAEREISDLQNELRNTYP